MPEAKNKSIRITFLLPGGSSRPVGGDKVVYEYANYLAKRGHVVTVVHPAISRVDRPLTRIGARAALRTIWGFIANKVTGRYKPTSWIEMSPSVRLLWVPSLAALYIPDGDVVFAGFWSTAEWVQQYPPSKGKKFYLIQHLETWGGPEERVLATWKMPLEKITIARWLQKIAEDQGESAHLVHNGLDFVRFTIVNPQENRDPHNILMLYHSVKWKGSEDGLAAFEIARKQEPGLKLTLFGVPRAPDFLPAGAVYYRDPPQHILRDLYNQASIFLSPSWTEGFPLPPAEALQCGAALVSTDIEGTAMYAIHEETALLSPVKDPEAMAANLLRLVRDPGLRLRLARNGHAKVQEFTWERAGSRMESILMNSLQPTGNLAPSQGQPLEMR